MSTRQFKEARRRLSTRLAGAKAQGEEARQHLQTRLATKLAGARRLVESTAVKQAQRASTAAASESLETGRSPPTSATNACVSRLCSDFDDARVLTERVERETRDPATGRWGPADGAVVHDLDLGPEWVIDCRAHHRSLCDTEGYTYAPSFNELEGVLMSGAQTSLSGLPCARQHRDHRVRQRKWVRLASMPAVAAQMVDTAGAVAHGTASSSSQDGISGSTRTSPTALSRSKGGMGGVDMEQSATTHNCALPSAVAPPSSSPSVSSVTPSTAARSASDLQLLLGKRLVLPGTGDKTGAYGHLWQAGEGQQAPEWLEHKQKSQSFVAAGADLRMLGRDGIDALQARLLTLVAAHSDRAARLTAHKAQLEAQLGEQRRKFEFLRRKYKQLHCIRDDLQQDIRAGVAQRHVASAHPGDGKGYGDNDDVGLPHAAAIGASSSSSASTSSTDIEACNAKLSTLRDSAEKVRADVVVLEQRTERALQRVAEARTGDSDMQHKVNANVDVHDAIRRALQSICTIFEERKLLRQQCQQLADDKKRLFDAMVSNRALQQKEMF